MMSPDSLLGKFSLRPLIGAGKIWMWRFAFGLEATVAEVKGGKGSILYHTKYVVLSLAVLALVFGCAAEQSQTEKSGSHASVPQPYEVSQARSPDRQIQIQQPQQDMQAEQSAVSQMTGGSQSTNAEQKQLAKSLETPAQSEGHPPQSMVAEARVDRKSERGSVGEGTNGPSSSSPPPPARDLLTPVGKWYEGGTLHRKTALDWQKASSRDKLATCSDFVAGMWQKGNLKPSIARTISGVDDFRPYAQQMVDFLDAAFKPSPDPEENRKLFTNQTVAGFAAIGMVTMGWMK